MGFFTSDLKLADVYADPTVRQAISPGQARTWAGDSMGIQGMLSNLGRSTQQTSGAFNYNIPSAEQLWSQINPGAGAIGGTGGVGVGAIGGTGGTIGTGGTGDQMTVTQPITDIGGIPGTNPVTDGGVPIGAVKGADSGSDYTEPYTAPMSLEEYLQSKEQTPEWASYIARSLGPPGLVSSLITLSDVGRGINPFYNIFGSSVLGEAPTYDWYEGNTDAFGNPYSDATLSSWMNSPSAVEERNIVDMYGFGSDQHMDFLDRGADEGLEGADKGLFDSVSDWFSDTFTSPTAPVEVVDKSWGYTQAPEVVEAPIPGVEYGHPEVITPAEYMDSAPSGVTDTGGYEDSSTGESFSADDFSEGGNMSDWGSAEEYADDFGFDEGGWDDASSDSGGGDSGGGGGGSYIATAATQALGEKGLKVFEDWRDYMFDALPTFTTSYGRYRVTAPKIVRAIDEKENSKNIYNWIWDMHLKPIFDMITEDRDSEKALKDYKIMVKDLQDKFLAGGSLRHTVKEKR